MKAQSPVAPAGRIDLLNSPLCLLPLTVLVGAVLLSVSHTFDVTRGLDFRGQLDYIRYMDASAWFPLANQGWQMYHPPAFFALSAMAFELLHRQGFQITLTQAGRDVSGLAWLLEGWVAIAIAGALGARWPSRAATAAVVWLLPAQAMVGSMVYNETVTDLGVGLVVLGVTLWARNQSWGLVWLGLGLPLAGLAKYSGLDALVIAVPLAIAVRPDRWTLTVLALLPGGALTAAYYIRNLIALGTPLPLNADIFDLKNWDPIRWGHPSGYFTNLSLAGCAAPDSFVGGFWKWFWGIDCSFQNLPSGPWSEQLPAWLVVVGGATSLFVLAATVLAVIGVRREPATILLTAIPMLTMIAFIYFNLRVPSATTDKGLYLLPALIPMAVAAGLLLDRLTPGSWVRLGYAAVMTWAMAMAAVSGVGP